MLVNPLSSYNSIIDGIQDVKETRLFALLSPEYPHDVTKHIEEILQTHRNEIVVFLEDDSTGVQKSHDVYLLTDYSDEGIRSGLKAARIAGHRLVFILTNSRALSSAQAEELNRNIATTLMRIAQEENVIIRLGSRSDSTLRGHFPLEPVVLLKTVQRHGENYDGIIVSHVFLTEMSRITVNKIHMIRIQKPDRSFWYRPVHQTKFAADPRFAYPTSNMPEYVEYKSSTSRFGTIRADDVLHIDIDTIRKGGPEEVQRYLLSASNGQIITFDTITPQDLRVFVLGLLQAEQQGKRFLYRTAASLPPIRVNMKDIPVLPQEQIQNLLIRKGHVLCLWGSIVELSNTQLTTLVREMPEVLTQPFDVQKILRSEAEREQIINQTVRSVEEALSTETPIVVYTVPRREYPRQKLSGEARVLNHQCIATALQEVYNRSRIQPDVIIFKGGTTSSMGLFNSGAARVYVLGQIDPGIPIVKIFPSDNERFPGKELLLVLGPGNVGTASTYVDIMRKF
jgi:uncharacterized protein YgbK (DUF1537 family)